MKILLIIIMILVTFTSCKKERIEPQIIVNEKDKPIAISLTIGNFTTETIRVRN